MKVNLDNLDFFTENSYEDQNYNKGNNFQDKEYSIEFKEDEKTIETDYSNPEYNVYKTKEQEEQEEYAKKNIKDCYKYDLKFGDLDFDLIGRKDKLNNEIPDTASDEIPISNSQTKKMGGVENESDEFGADANVFEKPKYIPEIK